ncbi:MAG: hypothetical protein AB8E15_12560 [Bdellovibrionales bacterium]
MKSIFLTTYLILISNFAIAETIGVFPSTGTKAKIIIQGNDSDAIRLFDSIQSKPIEENGVLKKTIKVESFRPVMSTIYEIICAHKLKDADNLTSCELILDSNYSWTTIDPENEFASLVTYGDLDSFSSYSEFIVPNNSNSIFTSIDNSLKILIERDNTGSPSRFRIEYKKH